MGSYVAVAEDVDRLGEMKPVAVRILQLHHRIGHLVPAAFGSRSRHVGVALRVLGIVKRLSETISDNLSGGPLLELVDEVNVCRLCPLGRLLRHLRILHVSRMRALLA